MVSRSAWGNKKTLLEQLQKLWQRGLLLRELINSSTLFPKRLVFKVPDSRALSTEFEQVQEWIAEVNTLSGFRVVQRTVRHRVIGENQLPTEVWIDSLETAILLLHKQREAKVFFALLKQTEARVPQLLEWVEQQPMKALALEKSWSNLLAFVRWRLEHPHPKRHLRQVNLASIDTKFIEQNRSILSSLLDFSLPAEQINHEYKGAKQFAPRYGFYHKPDRIRFRLLDSQLTLLPGGDADLTLTANDFQALDQKRDFIAQVQRVFITENEINFLTFPAQKKSVVIFGSGYGFTGLAQVRWLAEKELYYWGDIDTHGFAILDQLRSKFPLVQSLLMDQNTLLSHREFWGLESKQESRVLQRLSENEQRLYQDLLSNRYGEQLRLEQERIRFGEVLGVLNKLN